MKKILCLLICIMVALSLFSCTNSNEKDSGIIFDTVLYSSPEEYTSFFKSTEQTAEFEMVEFKDDTVKQSTSVNILGNDYKLSYETSAILPQSDISVNNYKINEFPNAKVLIDAKSGEIVKYVNIPHSLSITSEDTCEKFIQSLIGTNYNLSNYDYKCTTHYYTFSDTAMRSQVVDGFHVCSENEKLGRYSFYYTKSLNGVKISDHIAMEITNDHFSLEIYDLGYSEGYYKEILKDFNVADLEYSLTKHFQSDVKEGYAYNDIQIKSYQLFIKNEKPYIIATSVLTVTEKNSKDEVYATNIRTISSIAK